MKTESESILNRPVGSSTTVVAVILTVVVMVGIGVASRQPSAPAPAPTAASPMPVATSAPAAKPTRPQRTAEEYSAATTELLQDPQIRNLWLRGLDMTGPTLLVMVDDDGGSRTGYAEYVCLVLAQHAVAPGTLIRVIDNAAFRADRTERDLGSTICR